MDILEQNVNSESPFYLTKLGLKRRSLSPFESKPLFGIGGGVEANRRNFWSP